MKKKYQVSAQEIKDGLEKHGMNKYELYMALDVSEPTFKKYVREGFPVVYKHELIRLGIIDGELKIRGDNGNMVVVMCALVLMLIFTGCDEASKVINERDQIHKCTSEQITTIMSRCMADGNSRTNSFCEYNLNDFCRKFGAKE